MKKIKILCHVLCILLGICVYQLIKLNNVKPEVKVETKTEVKYLLGEKKECQDKGGNFRVSFFNVENLPEYTSKPGEIYVRGFLRSDYDYSLTCIKKYQEGNKDITETIFDYKI